MTAAHRHSRGTTIHSLLVRRTAVIAALVAAGALAAAPASAGGHRAGQEATADPPVGQVLSDQLEAAGIPGGAVVVVGPGGTVTPYGVGTTADGERVTADTPFVIGSTTKSFTASRSCSSSRPAAWSSTHP